MNEKKTDLRGPVYVLIAGVILSFGGLCIKMIPWSSMAINSFRCFLAVFVMLVYERISGHRLRWNRAVAVGSVASCATMALYSTAVKLTTSGAAIVIQFILPVWTILFSAILFHKKPRKNDIVTCLFVLAGIAVCFYEGLAAGRTLGNIVALFSGITYACLFMSNAAEGGDALSSFTIGLFFSALLGLPQLLRESTADLTPLTWGMLFFLGIVQIGIAYIVLSKGLETTPPVTATLLGSIEPVLNPIWVAIFYNEPITLLFAIGAGLVLISITVYQIRNVKQEGAS